MIIEFIKAHPAGIPQGVKRDVNVSFGKRMIDAGFAVEVAELVTEEATTEEPPVSTEVTPVEEVTPIETAPVKPVTKEAKPAKKK